MAQFGAKRPVFAPIKTTPDGALPTYDYEKKVTIGKLVKADLTVTNASGELYGDDALAEKVDMFASGSLALETDDKTDEVQTALHGATKDVESGEVTDSDGDVAPRGGLVYYKVIMRKGIRYFKGIFHPETKAILGFSAAIPAHGALRRNSQVTARKRIVLRGAIRNSANRQRVAAVKQSAERARGSIPPPALALWR